MKRHKRGFEETLEQHGMEYVETTVPMFKNVILRRKVPDKREPLNLIHDDEEEEE